MLRPLLIMLSLFLLTACGVRVEVAEIPQPTPTDRPWWRLYYDGSGAERYLASPIVSFGVDTVPGAELFLADPNPTVDMVQYRALWLPLTYTVVWHDAPASSASIRLNVYYRKDANGEWQLYDFIERELVTDQVPSQRTETIGISYWFDSVETVYLRAEVSLNARLANGETAGQVEAREFTVQVMSDPGDVAFDWDGLVPAVDVLPDTLLLDWRRWRGGPCALAERAAGTEAEAALRQSCDGLNNGDIWAALAPLDNIAIEDLDLLDQAYTVAGTMLALATEYGVATELFQAAAEAARYRDDVYTMLIHMTNLGTLQAASGDTESALRTFEAVRELRNQFWDEAGNVIAGAQLARLEVNVGRLQEAVDWFNGQGLPQADMLESWRFAADTGAP